MTESYVHFLEGLEHNGSVDCSKETLKANEIIYGGVILLINTTNPTKLYI